MLGALTGGCGGGIGVGGDNGTRHGLKASPLAPPPPPPRPGLEKRLAELFVAGPSAENIPATNPTGVLSLSAGWNMISFGVEQVTSVTPGAGVGQLLYAYDPVGSRYQALPLEPGAINSAGTARAFWVFASQETTIAYAGTGGVTGATLLPGWNLVGYPISGSRFGDVEVTPAGGSSVPLTASVCRMLPPPPGCVGYSIAFIYEGRGYQQVRLEDPATRTAPGRGVWIYAHTEATISWFPSPSPPLEDFSLGPYPSALDILIRSLQRGAESYDASTNPNHAVHQAYLVQATMRLLQAARGRTLPGGEAQRDALLTLALGELDQLAEAARIYRTLDGFPGECRPPEAVHPDPRR